MPDRLDSKEKNECWYFHVVVDDSRGRALDPVSAVIELYAGPKLRKRSELGAEALNSQRGLAFKKNLKALPENVVIIREEDSGFHD